MTRKLFATAGIIATAAGCALFAAPAATAATPAPSSFVECISCWGSPRAADLAVVNLGAPVGSALQGTRVG